jgi:hypothetical protein
MSYERQHTMRKRKSESELPIMPGMGRPDIGGMLQRRMNARLRPAVPQKGSDVGLFADRQLDLADTPKPRYRIALNCPSCGKTSEMVKDWGDGTPPAVNCGDCLMNKVEIVEMTVTGIEALK